MWHHLCLYLICVSCESLLFYSRFLSLFSTLQLLTGWLQTCAHGWNVFISLCARNRQFVIELVMVKVSFLWGLILLICGENRWTELYSGSYLWSIFKNIINVDVSTIDLSFLTCIFIVTVWFLILQWLWFEFPWWLMMCICVPDDCS